MNELRKYDDEPRIETHEFMGIQLRFVIGGGTEPKAVLDDIIDVLGRHTFGDTGAVRQRHGVWSHVNGPKGRMSLQTVDEEGAVNLIMMSHSPHGERVRRAVSKIMVALRRDGPEAAVAMMSSAAMKSSDPITIALQATLEIRQQQLALANEVGELRQQIGRGPSEWTISAWLSNKGIKCDGETAKREGLICRKISNRLGFIPNPSKVCSGGEYPARMWPMAVIKEWWPDFCRRCGRTP